ncbi:PAS domain-containing hybrid sensor histidine kinase/response regulator [Aliidiomarina soli]|uniref:histidine kinase n=1 Tax=Aliidiomarina soli TaxID=1928574 RepID=A0A432WE81_9GAMM|nr:PAS domain-containing hybrid sensor histidine kinase/response regulator [Aliidiomarina soli]RUO31191.1 sodium:proline symporter [Aliidiomarina soli]
MLGVASVLLVASLYLLLLFYIASRGERKPRAQRPAPWRYTLALGVHCTSWAFYGTVTQSAYYGWSFAPTYLGAIAVFLFAHGLQLRMLRVIKRRNITSIADFIGSGYGKSQWLAGLVAMITLVALIPYIALQLRAVTASFAAVTGFSAASLPWFNDVSTLVAIVMMGFAILFGARRLSLSEQHPGLMNMVAFESLVKLFSFMLVGVFVTYYLFDGMADLLLQAAADPQARAVLSGAPNGGYIFVTHMLLGALSMFVLPRQFQVTFIENTDERELKTARWGFPLYLFAINFFILPIALAGIMLTPQAQVTDTFMLSLPIAAEQPLVTLIAFIGGLSAATSMVLMATLALSIMIANDLITPLWVRHSTPGSRARKFTSTAILNIRRLSMVAIIALAWGYHQLTEAGLPLVSNGVIAMALLIQLAPSMLGPMLWSKGTRYGALSGILLGTLVWAWLLVWPALHSVSPSIDANFEARLSQGIWLSLSANLLLYIFVSMLLPGPRRNSQQSNGLNSDSASSTSLQGETEISWGRLRSVLARFVDESDIQALENRLNTSLLTQPADTRVAPALVRQVERELAGAIGSTASRLIFESLEQQPDLPLDQVVNWATEASRMYKFNRELLQASVENIPQGISVVDNDLRLVAWNRRYLEIFAYPEQQIHAGMPVDELLRYNAERGLFGDKSQQQLEAEVEKRLHFLRAGSAYRYQRAHGTRMIELQGNPMPEGGFVTTYTDITELVETQRELKRTNQELEQRVAERTRDLSTAKQAAEEAHLSKTRFFAAASHDLMQPFNAATLLCDMLLQRLQGDNASIVRQVQLSLHNAEELLSMLLEITKLDSRSMQAQITEVPLQEIFHNLDNAFSVVAQDQGLSLQFQATSAVVRSDRKLLQRILQNLLSNAIRYTDHGKVVCGVRRRGAYIDIQVLDTGIGIAEDKLHLIFDEFQQLESRGDNPGLGLGLAIVERIARLLGLPISIQSQPGKGTCFNLSVPLQGYQKEPAPAPVISSVPGVDAFLLHRHVLAVDNDPQVLSALAGILEEWGAKVTRLSDISQLDQLQQAPDVMVVDYHLDNNTTGVEMIDAVRTRYKSPLAAILNSADDSESIRQAAADADALFIPKPVKTAALKRLLKRLLNKA